MLRTILLLAFLLTSNAYANTIRATGTGIDFESAKLNAFSNALDTYVGTVVVSERELNNYNLVKNDILVYSSGYITDFKVINESTLNGKTYLILDISINTNRISNRILGKFSSNQFIDGNKLNDKITSYRKERQSADKLLLNILNDYPQKAYNIEQLPFFLSTHNRKIQIVMPYKLSWNYNYLMALNDVLIKTQDAKPKFLEQANSYITIFAKNPQDYVFGKNTNFKFNDVTHPDHIINTIYDRELRVMARIINSNNETVWYICHHPKFLSGKSNAFYSVGDIKNIVFYGNEIEQGEVRLDVSPELQKLLQHTYKIQLQIVKHKDC